MTKIAGREFEVLRMTGGRDIDRAFLSSQAAKITHDEEGNAYSIGEQMMRVRFYPPLFICAKGDVPTEQEFLDMYAKDVEDWMARFEEVNPGYFPTEETEEDLKKKEA